MQLNFSNSKFMLFLILCLAFTTQTLLKSKKAIYDKTQVLEFLEKKNLNDLIHISEKNTFSNDANDVLYRVFYDTANFFDEVEKKITDITEHKFTNNSKVLEFLESLRKQMTEKTFDKKIINDFNKDFAKIKRIIEKNKEGTNISKELTKKLNNVKSTIKARNSIIKPLAQKFKTENINSDNSNTEAINKFIKIQANNELQKANEGNENLIIRCIKNICSYFKDDKDNSSSKKRLLKSRREDDFIGFIIISVVIVFIGFLLLNGIAQALTSVISSPLISSNNSRTK